jgi:hypothetical protein
MQSESTKSAITLAHQVWIAVSVKILPDITGVFRKNRGGGWLRYGLQEQSGRIKV